MLLSSDKLKIVHVSTHCSLRDACDRAKQPRIVSTIRAIDGHLKEMGLAEPRLAVAGLRRYAKLVLD